MKISADLDCKIEVFEEDSGRLVNVNYEKITSMDSARGFVSSFYKGEGRLRVVVRQDNGFKKQFCLRA